MLVESDQKLVDELFTVFIGIHCGPQEKFPQILDERLKDLESLAKEFRNLGERKTKEDLVNFYIVHKKRIFRLLFEIGCLRLAE